MRSARGCTAGMTWSDPLPLAHRLDARSSLTRALDTGLEAEGGRARDMLTYCWGQQGIGGH